jgi:hypothetical protein
MLTYQIIIAILVAGLIFSSYIIYNLLNAVEKHEDIIEDQVNYLQNISNSITQGKLHLQNLDEKGVFQSDDEVGTFFKQMQAVQEELNRYMLPENYGTKESES